MHMLFKSGLLSQTGSENMALNIFKMQQNGEILDFKRHYKEFTSSYRAGTKFTRTLDLAYLTWIRVLKSN